MTRSLRPLLRRYGIEGRFKGFICPEHVKTIRFEADWTAEVTVRQTLAFLKLPKPEDLYDTIPVDPADRQSVIQASPDASEIRRTPHKRGTRVYWEPHTALIPYALHLHQHGWRSQGGDGHAALYTEYQCDVRTGIFTLEVVTPVPIETAITFKRPRWRGRYTERSLMKEALGRLEVPHAEPAITEGGFRAEWKLAAPKVGDHYVCVVFTHGGTALWRKRLRETTLGARVRRLVRSIAPTF